MSEFGDKDSMTQITGMSGRNIVVVFYAPWCEHCSQYREALMKYAKSQKGRCYVVTVDADKYPDLAKKFEVDAVPKTILYVEGMKLREMVGCVSAERLEKLISETLSAE